MGMNRGKALRTAKKAVAKKTVAKKAVRTVKKRTAAKAKPPRAAKPAAPSADQAMRALAKRIVQLTEINDDEGSFALYADNIESKEMGMPPQVGLEAIRQKFQMWRNMVRDAKFRARRVWVDGNTIIIEWDGRVTLAANGREAELAEVAVHEIQNGKIVRECFYYNPAALQP